MLSRLNKYKKFAMTLAELLVVFSIMGIIAAMSIKAAKPLDKGLKYSYSKAYHTLQTAIYNARTEIPKYLAPGNDKCTNGETGICNAEGMDGDWPETSENFCKMLLEYINYKPCSSGEYGTCAKSNNANGDVGAVIPLNLEPDESDHKYHFSVANCAAPIINIGTSEHVIDANTLNNELRVHKPHFIASNGMRFWIGGVIESTQVCPNEDDICNDYYTNLCTAIGTSDECRAQNGKNGSLENCIACYREKKNNWCPAAVCTTTHVASPVYEANSQNGLINLKFFIVIVDLNGSRRPNTTEWSKRQAADIVAFAVTNTNDVIPLGYPEIDRRYLSARVVYNSTFDQSDALGGTSNSMTFYEAKRRAWATAPVGNSDFANAGLRVNGENLAGADIYTKYVPNEDNDGTEQVASFAANSPFYLDRQKVFDVDQTLLNVTYDEVNCAKDDESAPNHKALDENACYVKISDYY